MPLRRAMYPKLDYKLESDFIPVGLISSAAGRRGAPGQVSVADLKACSPRCAARRPELRLGRQRHLAPPLAGELFKMQTQTFITHIPYRGAGPALQDPIAGQVDLMFDGLGSSAQHIRSGRIKALAVAGTQAGAGFPDIPTAAEAGVPGYEVATWYGLWAPRARPGARGRHAGRAAQGLCQ